MLFRIADPDPVVAILSALIGVDTFHRCPVGLHQVLMLPTQAYPAEGSVAIVEQLRPHDIFHVGRPDKTLFLVDPVSRDFLHAGIVNCFHKGVSIIEKVSSPVG
ncbi:hypothetical protein SDC9_191507 [bioreactor metagenome]|uniref:Uncharacterized protein n=1 Tax=bioreactor metagenome TaxID=1076179 RepID=A0A645HZC7_9ZZZZ